MPVVSIPHPVRSPPVPQSSPLLRYVVPVLVLMVGIALTLVARNAAENQQRLDERESFEQQSHLFMADIEQTVNAHKYLILGVRGLFNGSDTVERSEYRDYLAAVDLEKRFPGTNGIGWVPRVAHSDLGAFEQQVRDDQSTRQGGFPEFRVFPPSQQNEHHVVTYVEPSQADNSALGFDFATNTDRLAAVEKARDTARIVATSPIMLIDDALKHRGFLLILPVYSSQSPPALVQRRQLYRGSVVGAFRIAELMQNVHTAQFSAVKLYDVTDFPRDQNDQLLSRPIGKAFFKSGTVVDGAVISRRSLDVGGRRWEFQLFMTREALASKRTNTLIHAVTVLGILTSIVSALLVLSLVTARNRAIKRARLLSSELINANNALEKSNGELSQFAYVASRDLQAPVKNVDMSSLLLEDALASRINPQLREYLDNLRRSADRLLQMVEDLMSLAQVNQEVLQLTTVNLSSVCRNASHRLSSMIEKNQATLHIENLPVLTGDPAQLEKMFVFLFSNAIRFRHPKRTPEIDVKASQIDGKWQIYVKDNGVGIDPAHTEKVFEPFVRLNATSDTAGTASDNAAGDGSGLGLGICRQIVECHHGSISIAESSSAGTSVVISLPVEARLAKAA